MIDILIPTYGRWDRIPKLVANIEATTTLDYRITLIVDENKSAVEACLIPTDVVVRWNERTENYAGAINTAVLHSDADVFFFGADDLRFTPGWDVAAMKVLDDQFRVIGTNDLANPYVLAGTHATHFFAAADYIREYGGTLTEGPGIALPECYSHQFCDTEFIGVAKARVRFRPCLESVVEHLHPDFGKAPKDATYERATRDFESDLVLYVERKKAWDNLSR